jgi:hypothetical protein
MLVAQRISELAKMNPELNVIELVDLMCFKAKHKISYGDVLEDILTYKMNKNLVIKCSCGDTVGIQD